MILFKWFRIVLNKNQSPGFVRSGFHNIFFTIFSPMPHYRDVFLILSASESKLEPTKLHSIMLFISAQPKACIRKSLLHVQHTAQSTHRTATAATSVVYLEPHPTVNWHTLPFKYAWLLFESFTRYFPYKCLFVCCLFLWRLWLRPMNYSLRNDLLLLVHIERIYTYCDGCRWPLLFHWQIWQIEVLVVAACDAD